MHGRAAAERPDSAATLAFLRRILLAALCLGMAGSGLELVLLGHTEDWMQWIPLVLLGAGLLAGAAVALRGSATAVRFLRLLGGAFIMAGVVGVILHYRGNVEFELEMRPALGGLELVGRALTGATPALAPGTMILLGVLCVLYGYRHPATTASENSRAARSGADGPSDRIRGEEA